MVASSLKVYLTIDHPPLANFTSVPSLVPLQDAALSRMKSTLASEWKNATRDLGGLTVVDQAADITIYVAAAHGTSVHRRGNDDSEDVVIYVDDALGPQSVENLVATALHELGHIWCCTGPGTFARGTKEYGHWLTPERDPGLYGIDKFGLMNDPVECAKFGSIWSCPNRFSDREMRALGFASFPPPLPDPCVTQAFSLKAQINSARVTLADIKARVTEIDTQYGHLLPPDVYATYQSLVSQYNTLNGQTNQKIDQYNALPCDSS
jgi:hypothetical protein